MKSGLDLFFEPSRVNVRTSLARSIPVILLTLMLATAVPVSMAAETVKLETTVGSDRSGGSAVLGAGDLYALVVGVSKYRDNRVPALDLAAQDAKDFAEFLKTQDKVFRNAAVTLLTNEKASKAEIEKYLYYTLPKAGKDDTIILFLSGHGGFDPIRPKDFLFFPYDAESEYLGTTGVRMSGLDFLQGVNAERVLVIADACRVEVGPNGMKSKSVAPSIALFLQEARNSTGKVVINSAKDGQLSWEIPNRRGNSVFTHFLLEGLKGGADKDHDGVVTLNEAYEYAYGRTKDETKGRQHPQIEGQISGAFPLSYVGPGMQAAELKKGLLEAAVSGDAPEVQQYLGLGADTETRSEENDTPLIIGSRSGHVEVVGLLLSKGADLAATNNSRGSGLSAASENGHTEVVKLLLAAGSRVDVKDSDGRTPLAWACLNGHLQVAQLLLDEGADVKARTNRGETPLALAALRGRTEVVKTLLDWGAEVNAEDLDCATALIGACRGGHSELVKLLLAKGARVKMSRGGYRERELALAALRGDALRTREILSLGVPVDVETSAGDTPLTLAAQLGNTAVLKLLVEKGADVNCRGRDDAAPLILAASAGRAAVVQALLSLGASVNAGDKNGNTALICAAENGHTEVVKMLLAAPVGLNAETGGGRTALMAASRNGHADVVRLLCAAGAEVNSRDKEGNTALILASQKGRAEVVKLLAAKGADVNARNNEKGTALIAAARNGNMAVIKFLLSKGADAAAEDWEGKTALGLARERGRTEVAELLKSR